MKFFNIKTLGESFNYALTGIIKALSSEQNLRIHFLATALVLFLAWRLELSSLEVLVLLLTITLVIVAELMNTAVEYAVDLYIDEFKREAKLAKDIGAGAVLVASVNAVVVAYLVFFDKLNELLVVDLNLFKYIFLSGLLLVLLAKLFLKFLD
ncbi:diacylglycerol kinase family protein [Fuchsiella alkaliacetigena]|uniref:diacylglycerol kinase family protein n=1 Tax=Fuchsiella alkaliacetigena TaxID=957042 RepID=UPI00200B7D6C|nr:diacylglycerol kinase family protein [Fuchsiella alkaliacetigena]MCK8824461.1 diacylglycerol kinase family protein [Fuchsiella alkaliacetigena]